MRENRHYFMPFYSFVIVELRVLSTVLHAARYGLARQKCEEIFRISMFPSCIEIIEKLGVNAKIETIRSVLDGIESSANRRLAVESIEIAIGELLNFAHCLNFLDVCYFDGGDRDPDQGVYRDARQCNGRLDLFNRRVLVKPIFPETRTIYFDVVKPLLAWSSQFLQDLVERLFIDFDPYEPESFINDMRNETLNFFTLGDVQRFVKYSNQYKTQYLSFENERVRQVMVSNERSL